MESELYNRELHCGFSKDNWGEESVLFELSTPSPLSSPYVITKERLLINPRKVKSTPSQLSIPIKISHLKGTVGELKA